MLKALVFDFDGIIVDSEPVHCAAFLKTLQPLGIRFDYAEYLEKYVGFDDRDLYGEVLPAYGREVDNATVQRMVHEKAQAFEAVVREGIQACRGAVQLIHAAHARWPLAICSGATRRDIVLMLGGIGDGNLGNRFKVIVTADDVARSKPDPTCYRMAAEKLGLPGPQCLAIEDTVAGIAAANGAGMKTLGVATTHNAEFLNDADRVVASLAEVTVEKLENWFG